MTWIDFFRSKVSSQCISRIHLRSHLIKMCETPLVPLSRLPPPTGRKIAGWWEFGSRRRHANDVWNFPVFLQYNCRITIKAVFSCQSFLREGDPPKKPSDLPTVSIEELLGRIKRRKIVMMVRGKAHSHIFPHMIVTGHSSLLSVSHPFPPKVSLQSWEKSSFTLNDYLTSHWNPPPPLLSIWWVVNTMENIKCISISMSFIPCHIS